MDPLALFKVEGKVSLVTGGSRGIGEVAARALVHSGARVYIASRDEEACRRTAASLSLDGYCEAIAADLATTAGRDHLRRRLEARETRLDILINNAGTAWGQPIDEYSEFGWDKVMDLNLKSVFFLTQALLPLLRAAGSGDNPSRVLNIGSVDGLVAPLGETYAYAAAKAGLHHLTRVLARRLAAENILVNALAPGPFETKMMRSVLEKSADEVLGAVPLRRLGRDEDIAGAVLYFASPASAFVTGAVLPIDGGLSGAR